MLEISGFVVFVVLITAWKDTFTSSETDLSTGMPTGVQGGSFEAGERRESGDVMDTKKEGGMVLAVRQIGTA